MTGPDILAIQQKLAALGFAPGALDGAFGPTTGGAVAAFQASRGLPADGWVGAETRAALEAPSAAIANARGASPLGLAALGEAVKHLGVKEAPPGSNLTSFGIWFGVNGVPWCNIFVSYCFSVGAQTTICDGANGAGTRAGKGCMFVPTTESWLKATGFWVGRTEPCPGDIAIFNWDGGRPDHIGIVASNLGNGTFETIEGNTAIGNDSNGGEVMRRQRHLVQVDGFGRVVTR